MESGRDIPINSPIFPCWRPSTLPYPSHHSLTPPVWSTSRHHRPVKCGTKLRESQTVYIYYYLSIKYCDTVSILLLLSRAHYNRCLQAPKYRYGKLPLHCRPLLSRVFVGRETRLVLLTLSRFPLTSLHSKSWFSQTILDTPSSSRAQFSAGRWNSGNRRILFSTDWNTQDCSWWIFLPFSVVMIIEGEQAEHGLRLILSVYQPEE